MILDEVGALLNAQGVGTLERDLFLGWRPEDPDEVIAVQEYLGDRPELTHESAVPVYEQAQIQIMCRSLSYERARSKAKSAWDVLLTVANQSLSGTWYLRVQPTSSPALIGRDSNGRFLIGFNAACMKEVS